MTDQNSAVAEAIGTLQQQWMDAYTKRDTVFLNLCMSEDYVGIYPDGTVHNKKSEIQGVTSGAITVTSMEPKGMTVRLYGDAAIASGQSSVKVRVNSQDISADLRFTSVWAKSGNQWQAVAHQVTRIERPESAA